MQAYWLHNIATTPIGDPVEFQTISVKRSYEHIVRQIEDQIRHGHLVRGQKLPTEREMGDMFGVSRWVVREAVKVLITMGLVTSHQGSGIYVSDDPIPSISRALTLSVKPDKASIGSLYEAREVLEVAITQLAAARRTDAQVTDMRQLLQTMDEAMAANDYGVFGPADTGLHEAIDDAAGNPYLTAMHRAIFDMQTRVVPLIVGPLGTIEAMRIAMASHTSIVDAIDAGDVPGAAAAAREHVRSSSVVREFGRPARKEDA